MQAENPLVVFFDQRHRGLAGAGDIVTDVEIDSQVLAVGENVAVVRGRLELGVVVEADHDFVLVGNREISRVMPVAPRALAAWK